MASTSGPKAIRPASDLGPAAPRPAPKVTPVPVPKPGSVPSVPSSANRPSASARPGSNTVTATTPSAGFGLLAPADTNLQDAASGPHRDGRIRNPVPSKLKGKTDGSKGNFSVMHMEVAGRSEATERDAEAKRTSESTELAARRAFENGYVSLRRSRFVHVPDDTAAKPPIVPAPPVPAPAASPAPNTLGRQQPLNPEETKSEQARLLTLLRSLHPLLVVDQLCKALAFFGGIPGALPPADSTFPQSAEANGSGSLFVGWIAEIFPKLGGNSSQQAANPTAQLDAHEATKRRRGRPKGSKATKARKDKGVRKGAAKPLPGPESADADASWVDVDESAVGISDDVDANVMLLAQASSPHRPSGAHAHQDTQQEATKTRQNDEAPGNTARTALPATSVSVEVGPETPSNAKKRGRPKGSKNRPKDSNSVPVDTGSSSLQSSQASQAISTPNIPIPIQRPLPTPQGPTTSPSFAAVNSTTPDPKRKLAKPKGPAAKKKIADQAIAVPPSEVTVTGILSAPPNTQPGPKSKSSNQLSQQNVFGQHQALQLSQAQPLSASSTAKQSQTQTSGSAAQKRKRKGGKDAENPPPSSDIQSNGIMGPAVSPNTAPIARTPKPPTSAAPPPAKRQRKTKGEPKPTAKNPNDHPASSAKAALSAPSAPMPPARIPNQSPGMTSNLGNAATAATLPSAEQVPVTAPASVDPSMSSGHSPHDGHFEVQSPTMENYEAQLQAQLEQQAEPETQPTPTQPLLNPARLLPGHLQQQQFQRQQHQQHQQQQQHHHHQQQNPQQQQQQQSQHQQPSTSQSRSPHPPPPQSMKSQTASPVAAQQTRTPQTSYSQYRSSGTHFNQQHQLSYGSTPSQQAQQPHFTGQQQAAQVAVQPSQAPQYPSNAQQSFSSNQQYAGNHQQLASQQQRYQQQLASSSASTAAYPAQHSPQFGSSASNTFGTPEGGYRNSSVIPSATSYASQRSQTGTPTAAASYRAGSASSGHGLSHHSPSFGATANTTQSRPTNAAHSSQGMQAMSGVQGFSGSGTGEWFIDSSSLDSTGGQGTIAMSSGAYNLNPASVRTSSTTNTGFTAGAIGNFDASGLGNNDRFYGVGRR